VLGGFRLANYCDFAKRPAAPDPTRNKSDARYHIAYVPPSQPTSLAKFMKILARWCVNALALLAVAFLYSEVNVDGIFAALAAALVLGLVNAIIRPILILLTLPVTLLTMGLFIFVINALLFWLVAEVVKGFTVSGFTAAFVGSLMYSVITLLVNWLISDNPKRPAA